MKRILFSLFFLSLALFRAQVAYAGVVTYPIETNILLSSSNATFAVEAGSSVDSITVNDSSITVTVTAPDAFVLRSDNKYSLSNDGNYGISCGNTSKITVQPNSGTQTVVITPSTSTCTVSTSTSTNPASATVCTDTPPGAKAPWLYGAIPQDGNSILLYFTEADDPVNKYVLQFGSKSGDYPWGSTNIGGKGMRTYLVQMLSPNTTYYFRVRGGNGCATGIWSNEIPAKTKSLISYNQLDITNSSLETIPVEPSTTKTPVGKETQLQQGYDVKVKVIDTNKKPVEGATVTLHSNPQTTKTDKSGIALFHNVDQGEHKVLIAYNNYQGEQSVNLTGDVKEFDLNVTIQQKPVVLSPLIYGVIGIMGSVIVLLVVLLIKVKRKERL